ncbi:MAG: hypothetical protein OQJ81_03340 [Melioribacteraceae bacterium]|nr:hypothetical protein [Melioribacteraceae bacterium]
MKQQSKFNVIFTGLILFLLFMIVGNNIFAQKSKNVLVNINENSLGNLKNAITSDNPGLRKSGIYFAGKHSIKEVSETLHEQLNVEKDPSLKVLIIRVLYIIENDKYLDDFYYIARNDKNIRVRKMASAIYEAIQVNNSLNIVEKVNNNGMLK